MPMTKHSHHYIMVPAIKHRSPKYAALQTLNRQCWQTHGQITVRVEINHDDVKIYSKRLDELPQFPSISPLFPYIPLLLASELYRRKSGHHDPRKTFQVSEDNTSWGTRCQPQNRVHATKNSYRLRQSPSMHACSYLLYSLLVHSLISSSDVENHALLHILRFLIMTYSVRAKHNLS